MLLQKRSVHFRSIEILEFAYAVGDNPSVSSGVPLSMEWAPQMKTIVPLCVFETHRPPRSRECGPKRICSRRREKILLRNGCSVEDMITAASDVLRIQQERAFTQYQLQARKLMHSRRQREIRDQEFAEEVTVPSSPSISIIRKKPPPLPADIPPPPADVSPKLPQRRLSQVSSSTTIDCPSSPSTVSPRAADDKETLSPRLSPKMLQRPHLNSKSARTA